MKGNFIESPAADLFKEPGDRAEQVAAGSARSSQGEAAGEASQCHLFSEQDAQTFFSAWTVQAGKLVLLAASLCLCLSPGQIQEELLHVLCPGSCVLSHGLKTPLYFLGSTGCWCWLGPQGGGLDSRQRALTCHRPAEPLKHCKNNSCAGSERGFPQSVEQ